jgi:hypothetical protein
MGQNPGNLRAVGLALWLAMVARAVRRLAPEHPQHDPMRGLVQGGQHVGGGRSVTPTRDAPVPEGGGSPPDVEEEKAAYGHRRRRTTEATRWTSDHEVRLYKAPPPEVSTEQFYETYPGHGGKRRRRRIPTAFPWPVFSYSQCDNHGRRCPGCAQGRLPDQG